MSNKSTFTGFVEILEKGMKRHVIFIPTAVLKQLEINKNTRLIGTMNGAKFNLAALSDGEGRYYLTLGQQMRRAAGVKLGYNVDVVAQIDPNPNNVTLPEELEAALDTDPDAMAIFNTFTPGYKRSISHYVNTAKLIDTRIKRAIELCEKMKSRSLHGMKK